MVSSLHAKRRMSLEKKTMKKHSDSKWIIEGKGRALSITNFILNEIGDTKLDCIDSDDVPTNYEVTVTVKEIGAVSET